MPALELAVTAEPRCIGSKAYVSVRVTNDDDVPVDLVVQTAYGEKSFTGVAPGKHAFHTFSTRLAEVPAGEATISASAVIDGEAVTSTRAADYAAKACN